MIKRLLLLEKAFAVACFILYTQGIVVLILSGGFSQGDDMPAKEPSYALAGLLYLLSYAVVAILLTFRYKRVLYLLQRNVHIPLLLGLVFLSCLWSIDPALTLESGIKLVGTSLFGLYLASRYSLRDQLNLLGWSFGVIILLSLLFVAVLPQYGIMGGDHAGTWRGIYTHKNSLGRFMVFSVITFLLLSINTQRHRFLYILGLILSFGLILLSTSKTALISSVLFVILTLSYRTLRLKDVVLAPAVLGVTFLGSMISVIIFANLESLLGSLGRDLSFSGRSNLWGYALDAIRQRPLLGYGYGVFWKSSDYAELIRRLLESVAPHSHNGIIEVAIDLGILGLCLFLFGFFINVFKSLMMVRLTKGAEGLLPICFLTYLVLSNITESSLLKPNAFFWALYVMTTYSLASLRVPSTNMRLLGKESPNEELTLTP